MLSEHLFFIMFSLFYLLLFLVQQASMEGLASWIKQRCLEIDTQTGLLQLALELTRRALSGPLITAEESIRSEFTNLENKEELLSLYLTHAQELDVSTELLIEDDVTTLSLSSWLALSPLELLQRLLSVGGGDIATLARSLTQSEKLTHDQIQGYLCQSQKVDTFIGYCDYYITEVLPNDNKSEAVTFATFVLTMCYQPSQRNEWQTHECVECLLKCLRMILNDSQISHEDDLMNQVKECERVLLCVQEAEMIHDYHNCSILQIRDWMREDSLWVSSHKESQCSVLSLSDLYSLLKRPSIQYLQAIASYQLKYMTASSVIHHLQTLLQKSFQFLPSDCLPYFLLSVLLQVGTNDSLNTVTRLTENLRKDFIQETVLQVVQDSILSLNR